jgi:hypothetical protein
MTVAHYVLSPYQPHRPFGAIIGSRTNAHTVSGRSLLFARRGWKKAHWCYRSRRNSYEEMWTVDTDGSFYFDRALLATYENVRTVCWYIDPEWIRVRKWDRGAP